MYNQERGGSGPPSYGAYSGYGGPGAYGGGGGGGGYGGGRYGGGGGPGGYGGDNDNGYGGGGGGRSGGGRGRDGTGGYGGNSQHRGGGGYQGGDRDSRGGGGRGAGGRGGSGRDSDWLCPNTSCGNLNFARRVECNKCGAPSPAGGAGGGGSGGSNRGGSGAGYDGGGGGGCGSYDGGRNNNYNRDRSGSYDGGSRGGSYSGNEGGDDGVYGQVPQPALQSYGAAGRNHLPPPNVYGGGTAYGTDAVPPPTSYTGGPTSYPPSYGGPTGGYGGGGIGEGRSGSRGAYGGGGPLLKGGGYGGGGGGGGEATVKVKQCDGNCAEACDNSRIYISNLPQDVTIEELRELFGGIGLVGKIKQKRGYKDQWPWNIKIYTDDKGNNKGDAVLSYEDPSAAHSAGEFYNNYDMRGHKINVAMAEKSAPKAPPANGHGGGGRSGYGGGDRRRDNYRDSGSSGPDRHQHGGNRSHPY